MEVEVTVQVVVTNGDGSKGQTFSAGGTSQRVAARDVLTEVSRQAGDALGTVAKAVDAVYPADGSGRP